MMSEQKNGVVVKYIRENWTEWFKMMCLVDLVEDGRRIPRFYLPVRRSYNTRTEEYVVNILHEVLDQIKEDVKIHQQHQQHHHHNNSSNNTLS